MPISGSQVILCDLPIRFDTYSGCSHGCKYCFTSRKLDINKIKTKESSVGLINFINREKRKTGHFEVRWCDWDIPLHWGGMSDPFQPVEKQYRNSLKCLDVLATTGYPVVISTKGKIIAEPEYLTRLEKSKAVVQISAASRLYEKLEPGAPTFRERLTMIERVAPRVKRVIVRVQPYFTEAKADILNNLQAFKSAGAYGITVEGMKFLRKPKNVETVRCGADQVYPIEVLKKDFTEIKNQAHAVGLRFFAAENRLRAMGDDLCCCGVEGLSGFRVNTANLNHFLYDKENFQYTERMNEEYTATCFKAFRQTTLAGHFLRKAQYSKIMDIITQDRGFVKILLPVD